MIGLDTNVVVRYLTRDNEKQWQQAVDIIDCSETCFVSNIVLCELFWVLKGKHYQYSHAEIMQAMELMLQSPKFEFENPSVVYQAIANTRQGKADFADYLIGAVNHHYGCLYTATFDRKLKTARRFQVLN